MKELRIGTSRGPVSAVLDGPPKGRGPLLVLAHGAGGNLHSALFDGFVAGLGAAGVRCLRFNFPFSEAGRRSPDPERVLRETWIAAFGKAGELGEPLWAGGKSMGGRYASMTAADGEIDPAGLVFVGYPLHPPGKPDRLRDEHLGRIDVPMLFLQGTADPFARWDLLEMVVGGLGNRATLHPIEGGDHSFRVRGRPKDDPGTGTALGEAAARFILR